MVANCVHPPTRVLAFDMDHVSTLHGGEQYNTTYNFVANHRCPDMLSTYRTQWAERWAARDSELRDQMIASNDAKKLDPLWCENFNKRNDLQTRRHRQAVEIRRETEEQRIIEDAKKEHCRSISLTQEMRDEVLTLQKAADLKKSKFMMYCMYQSDFQPGTSRDTTYYNRHYHTPWVV